MKKIIYINIAIILVLFASDAEATSASQALKKIFRKVSSFEFQRISLSDEQIQFIENEASVTINGTHSSEIIMYTAKKEQEIIGYAFEDTVFGKWGPIHYLVGINPEGVVLKTIVLDMLEIRGKPIAKRRFLRQYNGKTLQDPIMLRRDIDGVTGATISSRSITDGIRKLLYIYEVLKDNK